MIRCALIIGVVIMMILFSGIVSGQSRPRARDLGIPFEGGAGPLNAITDVKGVEVGQVTLISGEGTLKVGVGPVRTGVTAILPRGKQTNDQVFAGWFSLNGNGEMTGTTWVEESGFLEGPIMITNTHSVGIARDSVIAWRVKQNQMNQPWSLPVVAETYDGYLNDINGFHVKEKHVFDALDTARSGPVAEGNVGGGTGMICYEFKGGIGTASRRLDERAGGYTVGVLVQANFGRRDQLRIAGVPVGQEITDNMLGSIATGLPREDVGSIIIVVATDAPLLPHQCDRLAQRAALGIGRMGGFGGTSSGDLIIAFATGNRGLDALQAEGRVAAPVDVRLLPERALDPLFEATVEATEESILNALLGAGTMTGRDGITAYGLEPELLLKAMATAGWRSA